MPVLFTYLLKVSVSLCLVYLFYYLVLRNLTFYSWNRWYLLGYSVLSFFLPLVNVTDMVEQHEVVPIRIVQYVPVLDNYATESLPNHQVAPIPAETSAPDSWEWVLLILLIGTIILIIKVIWQLISYCVFRKTAKLVLNNGVKIYQVNQQITPFSFGHSIFINQNLHTPEELKEIIRHEFVHVKQVHTLDIIWGEIMCILNWYNPFAWLLRHSLRQNLEFIADDKVVNAGIDKKQYQYLLLKVTGVPEFQIVNQFNILSLKNRIAMMNKMPSAKPHLIKFLFVAPLVTVSLLAFRSPDNSATYISTELNKLSFASEQPESNIGLNLGNKPSANKESENLFINQVNPTGKLDDKNVINVKPGEKQSVILVFKDGTQQKFDLATEAGKQAYDNAQRFFIGGYSAKDPNRLPEDYKAFLKRNPKVKTVRWRFDQSAGGKPDLIVITLKSGTEEVYSINTKSAIAAVENKYGKLPQPAPAPPRVDVIKFTSSSEEKSGVKQIVPPTITLDQVPEDHKAFLGRNPEVKKVGWRQDGYMVLFFKSGEQKKYNLNNNEGKAIAEKEYGKLPINPLLAKAK